MCAATYLQPGVTQQQVRDSLSRMEPGITTEPGNKSRGREEDEGMWLNREAEIEGALHEVALTGLLLQINRRNKQGRETKKAEGNAGSRSQ